MPPSKRNVRDTIEALKAIIDESLKRPEKKQEFVDEGSIQLIIGEGQYIKFVVCRILDCFDLYTSYVSYSKIWSVCVYTSIDPLTLQLMNTC